MNETQQGELIEKILSKISERSSLRGKFAALENRYKITKSPG
jgi:hypothetical protein